MGSIKTLGTGTIIDVPGAVTRLATLIVLNSMPVSISDSKQNVVPLF